jgi:hypothetical protein
MATFSLTTLEIIDGNSSPKFMSEAYSSAGTGSPGTSGNPFYPSVVLVDAGGGCSSITVNGLAVDSKTQGYAGNGQAAAGNPVQQGGVATDVEPSAVSTGQAVAAAFSLCGKQIVLHGANPENTLNAAVSIDDTSSHTFFAAISGYRTYINSLQVWNGGATSTLVTLTDGTSTLYLPAPAGGGAVFQLPTPFRSATDTAVTVQASASSSSISISGIGYKGV